MLRLLINLVILFFLIRMFRPVFQKVGQMFQRGREGPQVKDGKAANHGEKKEYDDLTPYEIEDADFEEIRRDGQ